MLSNGIVFVLLKLLMIKITCFNKQFHNGASALAVHHYKEGFNSQNIPITNWRVKIILNSKLRKKKIY